MDLGLDLALLGLGILRPIGVRGLPLRCLDISPLGFFLFIQPLIGFLSPTPNLFYPLQKKNYKTFIAYQTKKKGLAHAAVTSANRGLFPSKLGLPSAQVFSVLARDSHFL